MCCVQDSLANFRLLFYDEHDHQNHGMFIAVDFVLQMSKCTARFATFFSIIIIINWVPSLLISRATTEKSAFSFSDSPF